LKRSGKEIDMAEVGDLIVSVSGIRGIIGRGLTAEVATAFAASLGTYADGGPIVLSRDGRPSGVMLRHAALAGLLAAGCTVHDLGVAATPTCGLAVRRLRVAGGLQITASHNPEEWNGLKLFGSSGGILTAAEGHDLLTCFKSGNFRRVAWNAIGQQVDCPDASDWHRDRVLELVDVPAIRAVGFRAFLDANGGAGGQLGLRLLEALGAGPIGHGCGGDGVFAHTPEPVADNLRAICPLIVQNKADIGFVLDPDADRLALIDETGRYIGEELTLALAVRSRLQKARGPVVINMSTSRVNEDVARQFGVVCLRSAVGEANVVEKMRAVNALIGGEGNGGVIDPRVGYVRDPFIGMGLILELMATTGLKLSQLADEMPAYAIIKDKYHIARDQLAALYTVLEKRWPEAMANRVDGLRLDWSDRWMHLRPSNTEPIVRVIVEAPKVEEAVGLSNEVAGLLR
jgi:phosphomannomutase